MTVRVILTICLLINGLLNLKTMKRERLADAQNPDPEGNLKLVVTLLETMSVEEIRMMPDYILDPILESDELKLLPVVQKLKIARGKTGGE